MSELLSAADLAELKAIHTDNMPDRVSTMRPPAVLSGAGVVRTDGAQRVLTPAAVLTNQPCRVAPAQNAREFVVGDQVVASSYRWVGLVAGADVKERDLVTVTMGGSGEVLQLEVVGLQQPHSYEVGRFALCKLKGAP